MKRLLSFGLAVGVSLSVAVGATAQGTDPAELLPARTLAYWEMSDPARCAEELRALFKSSFLEDPLRMSLSRLPKDAAKELAAFALFLGPEAMDELSDWQALNVGLTGFTPQGYPELVGVLKGRPRLVSVGTRAIIALGSDECLRFPDGVEVYQIGEPVRAVPKVVAAARMRRSAVLLAQAVSPTAKHLLRSRLVRGTVLAHMDVPPPPAALPAPGAKVAPAAPAPAGKEEVQKEPPEAEFGLYCSMRPGCIIWGTTPGIVADVVRRTKGKAAEPSLARSPLYRAATIGRRRPDLFIYADAATLTHRIDALLENKLLESRAEVRKQNNKERDEAPSTQEKKDRAARLPRQLEEAEEAFHRDNAEWFAFRAAVNPGGMRYLTGTWTIQNSDWTWRVEGRMRPGQTSPFLELCRDQPLSNDLLRGLPRDSYLVLGLPVQGGAKTWARIVRMVDLCGDAMAQPAAASKAIEHLEKRLKMEIGRDIGSRVKGMAYALRFGPTKPEDVTVEEHTGPGVIAIEATDASAAAELGKLLPRLLTNDPKAPAPRSVTVAGQTIESLRGAEAMTSAEVPEFWGRRDKVLVLGWRRGDVVAALADQKQPVELRDHPRALTALRDAGPVRVAALFSGRQALAGMERILSRAPGQTPKHVRSIQYIREMSTPMALMPPTLCTLRCTPDRFCAELTQPEMRTASATVIDVGLAWLLDSKSND